MNGSEFLSNSASIGLNTATFGPKFAGEMVRGSGELASEVANDNINFATDLTTGFVDKRLEFASKLTNNSMNSIFGDCMATRGTEKFMGATTGIVSGTTHLAADVGKEAVSSVMSGTKMLTDGIADGTKTVTDFIG